MQYYFKLMIINIVVTVTQTQYDQTGGLSTLKYVEKIRIS